MTQELLKIFKACGCKGCIREGKWMPYVVVKLVGQTANEHPVKVQIPMYLCDKHKDEANPHDMLTIGGRTKLEKQVAVKYQRNVNWDTVYFEWKASKPSRVLH